MPLEKVLSTNDEKNLPTSTIAGSPLRSKFVDENSSRANELSEARQEAWESMRRDGRNETDTIICSRPGCGDHLRNVEALMYHLHIHNLDNEYVPYSSTPSSTPESHKKPGIINVVHANSSSPIASN
ncbi:hypothetical protein H0H93_015862 [Arthromyces matolae]|nr:hypothetical protein H0H93_015862 [Arthromyces matolae]